MIYWIKWQTRDGWHTIAWVLYPSFAVIIDDIYNPIFLSLFGGLFRA